jgi:hypothetical protein
LVSDELPVELVDDELLLGDDELPTDAAPPWPP